MNSKVLNYLSEKKDSFMDWFEANKTNIKTNATKVIATGLTLAALTNMAGCNKQLVGSDGTHSKHPMISDEQFTGETLPPALEVRPQEEITQENITAEDVLAVYDQLALLTVRHWMGNAKDYWGDDFYNISASFVSITPDTVPDYNFETKEHYDRVKAYYTYSPLYDGTNFWQTDPQSFPERIYPITLNVDIALNKEIFNSKSFTQIGISESDFLPIAEGFHSEQFTITQTILEKLYIDKSTLTTLDEHQEGYHSFTINRETIAQISDTNLLWALYNAAQNSLYSINFKEHFSTHHDLEMLP